MPDCYAGIGMRLQSDAHGPSLSGSLGPYGASNDIALEIDRHKARMRTVIAMVSR